MKERILFTAFFLILFGVPLIAQDFKEITYKRVDTTELKMQVIYPEKMEESKSYPAIVFYFGGGWSGGTIKQFEEHARYFSKRGMICFLVDYRVKSRQQTTPFESLKDAKSAIRYIRKNAKSFHVNTNQIVASGGSAGGHLAAATALIEKYNEDSDDLSVNCIPNALVLFNPVIDNGPGGYGYARVGEEFMYFSPLHNIRKGAPPTILFLGSADKLIPVETAKYYKTVMEKVKSTCELFIYEGQQHGFFNFKNINIYKETVFETDKFLTKLGFLSGVPTIND